MNFFIDAYDLFWRSTFFLIGAVRFLDCAFYSFLIILLIEKMGGKRFLFVKLKSLNPPKKEEKSLVKDRRKRLFSDVFFMSFFLYFTVKLPVFLLAYDAMGDYVDNHTEYSYKLKRDVNLEVGGLVGLTLMPYVWVPMVIGVNKFRQWVDPETMVTWKYHDERRECARSGYTDSCGYAMDMARALYRDDESLEIGLKYVEASKGGEPYERCLAINALRHHAEQTENMEMYKDLAKKRCELDCSKGCEDHKYIQILPEHRLKNNFSHRSKLSSFL